MIKYMVLQLSFSFILLSIKQPQFWRLYTNIFVNINNEVLISFVFPTMGNKGNPAELITNPNQTHSNKIIANYRQMCLIRVETKVCRTLTIQHWCWRASSRPQISNKFRWVIQKLMFCDHLLNHCWPLFVTRIYLNSGYPYHSLFVSSQSSNICDLFLIVF